MTIQSSSAIRNAGNRVVRHYAIGTGRMSRPGSLETRNVKIDSLDILFEALYKRGVAY